MHVDYLSVTMSEDSLSGVMEELSPLLGVLGIASAFDGLYRLHTGGTLRTGSTKGTAYGISASGDFVGTLRAQGLWSEYLMIVGAVPHRVTRMDVAHDVLCDAPKQLRSFRRRISRGNVHWLNKPLKKEHHCRYVQRWNQYGEETGSVYVGPKLLQVAGLKVYDKSHEQLCNRNYLIPSTLRYELTLGRKSRCSLHDAWEPDPVFWHFMAKILPAPDGVPAWVPYDSELHLPSRVTILPAAGLKRLVETSDLVSRALTLCDRIGPNGFDYFVRLLTDANARHPINPACNSDTGTGP